MTEMLLEEARGALREGRNEDAQALLINVIVKAPERDEAWLLLAEALCDEGKKRECLERARAINPRNRAILRALAQLDEPGQRRAAAQPPELPTDPAKEEPAPVPPPTSVLPKPADSTISRILNTRSRSGSEEKDRARGPSSPVPGAGPVGEVQALETELEPLLEWGEQLGRTLMLAVEPRDARQVGTELLRVLDKATKRDPVRARRWARSSGREALWKFQKVLTGTITSLPRDDPDLVTLRQLRQRALAFLR